MNRSRLAGCAAALVISLSLAACGDDDSTAGAADTAEPAESAADAATIEVVAVDFGFEGLPDSVEAGTTLTLRNDAEHELHEIVAFRLDDDETRSVEEIVALPPEEMQAVLGEPTTVILAPPRSTQVATPIGDGTLNEPGRYAIICTIPTGADADEFLEKAATSDGPPDVAGGPPHLAHGMYAELLVE